MNVRGKQIIDLVVEEISLLFAQRDQLVNLVGIVIDCPRNDPPPRKRTPVSSAPKQNGGTPLSSLRYRPPLQSKLGKEYPVSLGHCTKASRRFEKTSVPTVGWLVSGND